MALEVKLPQSHHKSADTYPGDTSRDCSCAGFQAKSSEICPPTEAPHPPLSDRGALDSSSALSSGMASWTGMISGCLLISWIVVGGAFRTGLATTVDGVGCGGWTTSLTWGEDRQQSIRLKVKEEGIYYRQPTQVCSRPAVVLITIQVRLHFLYHLNKQSVNFSRKLWVFSCLKDKANRDLACGAGVSLGGDGWGVGCEIWRTRGWTGVCWQIITQKKSKNMFKIKNKILTD